MPKKPPREIPSSRHSYEAVSREVQRVLKAERGKHKAAAAELKLTSQQLTHRLRGIQSHLSIEEMGALADWAHAPMGWPLISWDLAREMEEAWKKHRKAGTRG